MSGGVAALEQAMLDLAVSALTAGGRPVPDPAQVYRYHSDPAVQCCEGNGDLFVFWRRAFPDRTGIPAGMGSPPGRSKIDLFLRLFRCFPTLGDRGEVPVGLDAAAEGLALDLDVLWRAFETAICTQSLAANLAGCDDLLMVDASPRSARGGCAGVELHFTAAWRPLA